MSDSATFSVRLPVETKKELMLTLVQRAVRAPLSLRKLSKLIWPTAEPIWRPSRRARGSRRRCVRFRRGRDTVASILGTDNELPRPEPDIFLDKARKL
jgi:hypothetical protein